MTIEQSSSIEEGRLNYLRHPINFIVAILTIITLCITIWIFFDENEHPNIVLVVDTSLKMEDTVNHYKKWDLLQDLVSEKINYVARSERLSLRSYSGECGRPAEENSRLLVPIVDLDREKILSELGNIKLSGKSTMISGIVQGLEDLTKISKEDRGVKKLIVFAGALDECFSLSTFEKIKERIAEVVNDNNRINVGIKLIAFTNDGETLDFFATLNKNNLFEILPVASAGELEAATLYAITGNAAHHNQYKTIRASSKPIHIVGSVDITYISEKCDKKLGFCEYAECIDDKVNFRRCDLNFELNMKIDNTCIEVSESNFFPVDICEENKKE